MKRDAFQAAVEASLNEAGFGDILAINHFKIVSGTIVNAVEAGVLAEREACAALVVKMCTKTNPLLVRQVAMAILRRTTE